MLTEREVTNEKKFKCTDKAKAQKALDEIQKLQQIMSDNFDGLSRKQMRNYEGEVKMWRHQLSKNYVPTGRL